MPNSDIKQDKRLAIFAYFDKDGIIDDYIVFLLRAVLEVCNEQIVVINGKLNKKDEEKIKPYCTKLIYRENIGFDITAYKEAFLSIDNLDDYSEIVFYNQTIFGPVCSLQSMFNLMKQKNVDFWGLSAHKGAKKASWDTSISIEPHIQSYFFAVRNKMFKSKEFNDYWQNLPEINSYWDAVGKHEIKFTKHFENLGFKWDVYLKTDDLMPYNDYPMMGMPIEMLRRKSPFFKRKSFLQNRLDYTSVPQGYAAQELYDYIRINTDYPLSLICENITRTVSPVLLQQSLTLLIDTTKETGQIKHTVAVFYFASEYLAYYLCNAASKMQKDIAILCIFANEELKDKFSGELPPKAQCIVTKENGIKYLFGDLWKDICVFENILYCHNNLPVLLGEFYDATSLENTLNALIPSGCGAVLANRDDIGAFVSIAPMHQENLILGQNYNEILPKLSQKLKDISIDIPDGKDIYGYAVKGCMFFAKTSVIEPLSKLDFTDDLFEGDYPIYEYLLPFVVQSKQKLLAVSCTAEQAFNAYLNSNTLLQTTIAKWHTKRMVRSDQVLFRMQGILDFYNERRHQMTLEQAFTMSLSAKEKVWICLQIILKPASFLKLKKLLKKDINKEIVYPVDELE